MTRLLMVRAGFEGYTGVAAAHNSKEKPPTEAQFEEFLRRGIPAPRRVQKWVLVPESEILALRPVAVRMRA